MQMQALKAAQVIHSLAPGGAERVVCHLATGLKDHGIMTEVFCMSRGGHYESHLKEAGVPLFELGKRSKWGGPTVTWKLASLLRKRGIDVMHAHNLSAGLYGRTAALLAGTPVRIITFHSYTNPHSMVYSLLNRLLYPASHRLVAVSEFVARGISDQYPAWDEDRIRLIYNGLDTAGLPVVTGEEKKARKVRLGLDPDRRVIGTVANLTAVKNHALLLEAAAAALGQRKDLHFLLVGGGPLEQTLKARAESLGITDHISFVGFQQDVFLYLSAMDLFVISSRREGLPMSVLEAMAAGLPVVATRVGGIPEAALEGETGLLCPAADASALSRAILDAVSDPGRLAVWGDNARSRVAEAFSLEKMCRRTAGLYREAFGETAAKAGRS
jgi:glycosyltransferase involved in cell wall biosynthesis